VNDGIASRAQSLVDALAGCSELLGKLSFSLLGLNRVVSAFPASSFSPIARQATR
jgi:hypothetical protein